MWYEIGHISYVVAFDNLLRPKNQILERGDHAIFKILLQEPSKLLNTVRLQVSSKKARRY